MATKRTKPDVPTSFYLVGCEWKVKFVDDLSEYGKCDCATQMIYIRSGMNKAYTEQTFFHELVHAIMFSMGHSQHDEVFIDAFGQLLHQYDKTKL